MTKSEVADLVGQMHELADLIRGNTGATKWQSFSFAQRLDDLAFKLGDSFGLGPISEDTKRPTSNTLPKPRKSRARASKGTK